MPCPPSYDAHASSQPHNADPAPPVPNALRNALIEISDLRSTNQQLQDRVRVLFCRLKELCAARGLPAPRLEDL